MKDSSNQDSEALTDAGLLASAGALVNSRLALATAEARLAVISIALILIAALGIFVFGISVWALLCFAFSQWLLSLASLTVTQTLLIVAGANLLCLAICGISIWRLLGSLRFKYSLNQEQP